MLLRLEPRLQQAEQLHKPTARRRVNDRPRSLRQFRRRLRAQAFLVHEEGNARRARAVRTGEAVDQNLQSGGGESAVSERQQTERCGARVTRPPEATAPRMKPIAGAKNSRARAPAQTKT